MKEDKYLVKKKIKFSEIMGRRMTERQVEHTIVGNIRNFGDAIDEFKFNEFKNLSYKWAISGSSEYEDIKN